MVIINKKELDTLTLFDKETRQKISNFINILETLPFKKGKVFDKCSNLFCYAQEYYTHPFDKRGWERHKVYYDVQYIQNGEELIYFNPCEPKFVINDYDEKSDCELVEAHDGEHIVAGEGNIVIFKPGELHNTGVSVGSEKRVIKYVIKCKGVTTWMVCREK